MSIDCHPLRHTSMRTLGSLLKMKVTQSLKPAARSFRPTTKNRSSNFIHYIGLHDPQSGLSVGQSSCLEFRPADYLTNTRLDASSKQTPVTGGSPGSNS